MDQHPIQGAVEILLVASCYGNRDKLRTDEPLGWYADFYVGRTPWSGCSKDELRAGVAGVSHMNPTGMLGVSLRV